MTVFRQWHACALAGHLDAACVLLACLCHSRSQTKGPATHQSFCLQVNRTWRAAIRLPFVSKGIMEKSERGHLLRAVSYFRRNCNAICSTHAKFVSTFSWALSNHLSQIFLEQATAS